VYRVQLGYDASGRPTQKTETIGGVARVFDYTHDPDGHLIRVQRDGTAVEQYTYDANGNRVSRMLPGGSVENALYDVADRLTQRGGAAVTSSADGYVTSNGSAALVYDVRGALTQAAASGRTIDYAYDALGRRVSRTDPAGTTQYLYGNPSDPMQVTAVRDPSGLLTTLFYDEEGRLIALARGGARFYVGTDHLGTPRVITDATGAVMKRLDHDSYGVPLADSNPSFALPIGFAGGLTDADTGLLRFGFRDYDPPAGRWTARDPALFSGGQANLYAYVNNGPVAYRDPLGLFAFCFGFSFYAGYGGGLSVCTSGNDLTLCGEVGLGLGGGVGGAIDSQMPRDNETVGLEAGVQCGPVTVGGGITLDDCGDLKAGPAIGLGLEGVGGIGISPVSVSPGTASAGPSAEDLTTAPGPDGERVPTGKLGQALKDRTPPKFGPGGKCQVGGKLAASGCRSLF
jgi:RHS repeat-associated protein